MSMCGELENLEHEINQAKAKLGSLEQRRNELTDAINLDPDKRDWEYDGYGVRRDKDKFQPVVSNLGTELEHREYVIEAEEDYKLSEEQMSCIVEMVSDAKPGTVEYDIYEKLRKR